MYCLEFVGKFSGDGDSGHYTSYVKCGTMWVCYSDTNIFPSCKYNPTETYNMLQLMVSCVAVYRVKILSKEETRQLVKE